VLNCCVTETNDTPRASNSSISWAKSLERAGQAVDLIDHYDLDFAGLEVGQQTSAGRSRVPPE